MLHHASVVCAVVLALGSCKGKDPLAKRHGVRLAEGYTGQPLPQDALEIVVSQHGDISERGPADSQVVLLTIDTLASWNSVSERVRALSSRDLRVTVGQDKKAFAIPLHQDFAGDELWIMGYGGGKACLWPDGAKETACVKASYTKRVERGPIMDLVKRAMKKYDTKHVSVLVDDAVKWGDIVRLIDGPRQAGASRVAFRSLTRFE